jgi:catechol 2,3-dioxygenase-like lactoylglutathione lyase family enzyme
VTIAPQTTGVHHLTLRSGDLARAREFYGRTLALPIVLETWDSFVALAGSTLVVVRSPGPRPASHSTSSKPAAPSSGDAGEPVDRFRAGLESVALACAEESELERVAHALEAAGVPSTGLRFDAVLRRRYVAFSDPDGIAWEFYMAFSHTELVGNAGY